MKKWGSPARRYARKSAESGGKRAHTAGPTESAHTHTQSHCCCHCWFASAQAGNKVLLSDVKSVNSTQGGWRGTEINQSRAHFLVNKSRKLLSGQLRVVFL